MIRGATRLYYQHMNTDQCPATIDLILWIGIFSGGPVEISMNSSSRQRWVSRKLISWLSIMPLRVITHAKENCYITKYKEQLKPNRFYREKPKKRKVIYKKVVQCTDQ